MDTYRGEIITEQECKQRDRERIVKDIYTFALDKFHADNQGNEWAETHKYVVDGECMGGPTRYINHSCDPNLRQFTVSYNHSDPSIYDLAFFAVSAIPAGTELTFDYLDRDVDESDGTGAASAVGSQSGSASKATPKREKGMTRCLCGSEHCKGFLWL